MSGDRNMAFSLFVHDCFSRVRRTWGSFLPTPACSSFLLLPAI